MINQMQHELDEQIAVAQSNTGATQKRLLVFVYGTLKKGFSNHVVMESAGGKLVAETTIPAKQFRMLDLGAFPALHKSKSGPAIHGEVYECERLAPLDRLEGYPSFYDRERVELASGHTAWVYFMKDPYGREAEVADGKWKKGRRVHC